MSKQLLIPQGQAPNATEIAAIAATKAGVAKIGETATIADISTIDANELIQIFWKKSGGKTVSSIDFSMGHIKKMVKIAASAGTVQQSKVVPVLPAVQEKGDEYILRIIDTTKGTMNLNRKNFSVFHQGADFSVASLIDAFVALIGTDEDLQVVATDGSTELVLSGTTPENHFRIAVDGELSTAAITYTQHNAPSNGKAAKMKELEEEFLPYQSGVWNKTGFPVKKPDSEVAGDNYTQYVLHITKPDSDKSGMQGTITRDFKIVIAETADGLGKAIYDAFSQMHDIPNLV